ARTPVNHTCDERFGSRHGGKRAKYEGHASPGFTDIIRASGPEHCLILVQFIYIFLRNFRKPAEPKKHDQGLADAHIPRGGKGLQIPDRLSSDGKGRLNSYDFFDWENG